MKRTDWIALAVTVVAYLALRGLSLFGPFVLPFETAFQESIALHHLTNGIAANRFLSVIATFDGVNYYHTAHPPLLQILYAMLYKALGVHEWVTRLFSLLLFASSTVLWRSMLGKDARYGWLIFPLAFFLPMPFLLATTTNYEPLSLFFISLIGWMVLTRDTGLKWMVPVLVFGMLVDWPVYLAVPALIVLKWRDPKWRNRLLGLFALEIVFFGALQLYTYSVAGEAAFFSHAPERANPFALLRFGTYAELFSHFMETMGAPAAIIALAAVAAFLVLFFRGRDRRDADAGVLFFIVVTVLLVLSAPSLVSRHYVYLLYFTAPIVLAAVIIVSRSEVRLFAVLALALLFVPNDYIKSYQSNPSYYVLAEKCFQKQCRTAFASTATGALRYYAGVETAHPVSVAMSRWLAGNEPDAVLLDKRHGEVSASGQWLDSVRGDYTLWAAFPGEEFYFNKRVRLGGWRYLIVEDDKADWKTPATLFTRFDLLPQCPVAPCVEGAGRCSRPPSDVLDWCGGSDYAIRQRPGPSGSALVIDADPGWDRMFLVPAVVHSLPFVHSDGVSFMTIFESLDGQISRLAFARTLGPEKNPYNRLHQSYYLNGAGRIIMVTTPGPRLDQSFDDAYWLAPIVFTEKKRSAHGQ